MNRDDVKMATMATTKDLGNTYDFRSLIIYFIMNWRVFILY